MCIASIIWFIAPKGPNVLLYHLPQYSWKWTHCWKRTPANGTFPPHISFYCSATVSSFLETLWHTLVMVIIIALYHFPKAKIPVAALHEKQQKNSPTFVYWATLYYIHTHMTVKTIKNEKWNSKKTKPPLPQKQQQQQKRHWSMISRNVSGGRDFFWCIFLFLHKTFWERKEFSWDLKAETVVVLRICAGKEFQTSGVWHKGRSNSCDSE